jgi:hypothetical protein
MAEKILRARRAFITEVRGKTVRVSKGLIVDANDPLVDGREHLFGAVTTSGTAPTSQKAKKPKAEKKPKADEPPPPGEGE